VEVKRGIPVSHGIAIAEAFVLDSEEAVIPRRQIRPEETDHEVQRVHDACAQAIKDTLEAKSVAARTIDEEFLAIFDSHVTMLQDKSLREDITRIIENEQATAEWAVQQVMHRFIKLWSTNEFLADRVGDLFDLQKKLLRSLLGKKRQGLNAPAARFVLIAHNLTPSQTVHLDRSKVIGFATDTGGRTSHTALLARALGIPAVVGAGDITAEVNIGDTVIVDGTSGVIVCRPDTDTLTSYETRVRNMRVRQAKLSLELKDVPPETQDGYRVELFANIEFPEEIPAAIEHGAEGVGLYRTEYLYVQKGHMPTEAEHFQEYKKAAELLAPRPLTIRTLDMGGDKLLEETGGTRESNPSLGCRSIRFCFEREDIFRTQLRAIMRASAFGNVRVLFPMISNAAELRKAHSILNEVMDTLKNERISFDPNVRVGIMVEVPSAAWIADILAKDTDFFSLGTNDLVQYSMAVDRGNERVANLYQPAHPAILRLLQHVIDTGRRTRVRVGMCGEMSGELSYTILLLGLGLKEFSVSPAVLPEVKEIIRQVTMSDARTIARQALAFEQVEDTIKFLSEKTREILPDFA